MNNAPVSVARWATEAGAPVVTLTLDNGLLNLFDVAMFDALKCAVADLTNNPPRAVLMCAAGKVTSAGVDVHEFDGLTPSAAEA